MSARTLVVIALSAVVAAMGSTPAIGVAISNGNILINNAKTVGNASLFEGSTVETDDVSSRVQLKSGTSLQLAAASRGKVYGDHMVLEKGGAAVGTPGSYEVDTKFLRITGKDNAAVNILVRGDTVKVASLSGFVQVANASGVFVANVTPGTAYDFTPGEAAAPDSPGAGSPGAGSAGAGAGSGGVAPIAGAAGAAASHVAMIAGIAVVATVSSTATLFGTQNVGTLSLPPDPISPGRTN